MTIALRGPIFMKVCGSPLGSRCAATINSSSASAFFFTPTRKSASGTRRDPRTLATSTSAPSMSSGGSASPAGEAVPRLPPIVPRLRICGEPTVRAASANAGMSAASDSSIASVYVSPAPSRTLPFVRDQPRSSSTSFRFRSASGRARSKLRATMTSVPPWIGSAPGCSALSRSASSRVRGVRTSTTRSVLRSPHGNPPSPPRRRPRRRARRSGGAWGTRPLGLHQGVAGDRRRDRGRRRRRARQLRGPGNAGCVGQWIAPGFIDAHMHLESTKLLPDEFARLVLPLGTTAVVADPHELANVLGTDGVHWLLDACEDLPFDFYFMASSCVRRHASSRPAARSRPGISRACSGERACSGWPR